MSLFSSRSGSNLFLIFFLALILRLGTVCIAGDRALEYEFDILVHNVLTGNGYSWFCVDEAGVISHKVVSPTQRPLPSAYVPPAYPLFLAGICRLFGTSILSVILIEIIQALLGALGCILLYEIGRSVFNRTIGLLSASLYAVYPTLVFMCGQISAVNLYVFLNLTFLFLLIKGTETRLLLRCALAGFVFSLLVLARTDALILLPAVLIWLLIALPGDRIVTTLLFLLASLVLVGAWAYRNYRVFEQPVLLTTSTGYNLWLGQNEHATGTRGEYTVPPFTESDEMWQRIHALTPDKSYEIKRDRLYWQEATSFMQRNPDRVIALAWRKFIFYWAHYWGIVFTYPHAGSVAYWLPWFMILPFFLIGIVKSLWHWKKHLLFYFYFIVSTLTVMTFFVIPRYRLFIVPLVLLFAAHGIVGIGNLLKPRNV